MESKIGNLLCAVPLTTAFTDSGGIRWRNCCSASPQISSNENESFIQWWYGDKLERFRQQLTTQKLPGECANCEISERLEGKSFRTAINSTVDMSDVKLSWPKRWNISVGNLCNLACWTCSENSSSLIEKHKKHVGILPDNWKPNSSIPWAEIENSVLQSFDHHDTVDLTLLGGEPLFNKTIIDFLKSLRTKGLAKRTRLEFHTNGTIVNQNIKQILSNNSWLNLCMFVSLDSTDRKAEWLRYGCTWQTIEKNLDHLKNMSDYIEVHVTLSILNILDLGKLKKFCDQQNLPMRVSILRQPEFMAITNWDASREPFFSRLDAVPQDFYPYFDMIGSTPIIGSKHKLLQYIESFKDTRQSLQKYDEYLYSILTS